MHLAAECTSVASPEQACDTSPMSTTSHFDEKLLRELGLVTALGALVEDIAMHLVSDLATIDVDGADMDTVAPLVYGQPIGWLLDRIAAMAPRCPSLQFASAGWVTQAREAMNQRNAVVHAAWVWPSGLSPTDPPGPLSVRRRVKGSELSVASLDMLSRVSSQLDAVWDEGVTLSNTLIMSVRDDE